MNLMCLQNGSDIRGVALETDGGGPVNLTKHSVTAIGCAFAQYLKERLRLSSLSGVRIAIGRDSRLTGQQLVFWLASGIISMGATAYDAGMASTPAMFMACVNELDFDAAIMVTASHLPMERNGMKFFTKEGGLEKADITTILSLASADGFSLCGGGSIKQADIMSSYILGLRRKILCELDGFGDRPFEGLKIVVDAGNGAGGFFASELLKPLGADITGSLYLEPDGNFPNHQPNPENAQAMECIKRAVVENNADMGIIFDTDVDRAGAALPFDGGAIALDRNRLIAMMAATLVKRHGGITVVTDSITSNGLNAFLRKLGCRHHRYKRGYRNVINEAKRLIGMGEKAYLAMETSGHGAFMENRFLDDGAYIVVELLIELVRARHEGRALISLIDGLCEARHSLEVRLPVLATDFASYADDAIEHVKAFFKQRKGYSLAENNFEGVRVNIKTKNADGWFLIRKSLHDPLMPCNFESDSARCMVAMLGCLNECLLKLDGLDALPLEHARKRMEEQDD